MNPAPPVTRTAMSDGAREMSARKLFSHQIARRPSGRGLIVVERIQQRAVARGNPRNVVVPGIEEHAITSHSAAPQSRNELGRLDGTRMKQAISARTICRD